MLFRTQHEGKTVVLSRRDDAIDDELLQQLSRELPLSIEMHPFATLFQMDTFIETISDHITLLQRRIL